MKNVITGRSVIRAISAIGAIGGAIMFVMGIMEGQIGIIVCSGIIGLASMRFLGTTFEADVNK